MKPGAKRRPCLSCDGLGQTHSTVAMGGGVYRKAWSTCRVCEGAGVAVREADRCPRCQAGRTERSKRIEVRVERGMADGHTVPFLGEGDEAVGAAGPGDLFFRLRVQPHPTFRVAPSVLTGFDLETAASLTLSEALLGFQRVLVVHVDGTPLRVAHPGPILAGQRLLLRGQGLWKPRAAKRGDLYVKLEFEPDLAGWLRGLSPDQRKVLEALLPAKRADLSEGDAAAVDCVADVVSGPQSD